ncbi:MAG: FAD-binding oxidoreductase [Candidatus Aegiribacteria sp.]|nr:FAD-binding oxidoreductase [Candidatus Aegiribacteria sp.]
MRSVTGRKNVSEMCADLLQDESNLSGAWCEAAAWPENTDEAEKYIRECSKSDIPLTVSGGLTGISGGALPQGGAVISASALKDIRCLDNGNIVAGAGVTIEELNSFVSANTENLFYPPDPTEETASVGGTIATDASGADSFLYGSTRKWVEGLEIVLPDGKLLNIKRGLHMFDNLTCTHPVLGTLQLPSLRKEQPPKNAAGYHMRGGMDLIDLFIGSEGTLGFIVEAELKLAPEPVYVIDLAVFPENAGSFWKLFNSLLHAGEPLRIRALEMMDNMCMDFLRSHPGELPLPPENAAFCLLLRAEADSDEHLEKILVTLDEMLVASNSNPETAWGGFEPSERKRIKDFRHALPEAVNHCISESRRKYPSIHKFGSDGAVEPSKLEKYYTMTRSILEERGLPFVIFGHAGDGHIHANAMPQNPHQMLLADSAMREIATAAVEMGGTVSAEHGLGKMKLDYLKLMYSENEIRGMETIRRVIDRDNLMGP